MIEPDSGIYNRACSHQAQTNHTSACVRNLYHKARQNPPPLHSLHLFVGPWKRDEQYNDIQGSCDEVLFAAFRASSVFLHKVDSVSINA